MTQVSSTNKNRFFTAAMGHNLWFNVKDNMKLMIVIFVLHFAAAPLLLTAMLTQLAASHRPDVDGGFIAAAIIGTGLAAAAGMICALSVFKYLYKKSAVDMRLSLPMTTGQRFVSDFLSGLFIYVVPFIGAEIVSLLLNLIGHLAFDGRFITEKVVLGNGEIDYYSWECHIFEEFYPFLWRTILGGLMLMVMFYVITVIAAGCCGNIFESAAYDILLCGLVPLAVVLAVSTVSQNINGFDSDAYLIKLVPWCGPFGGAYGLVMALQSLKFDLDYESYNNNYDLSFGKWFIIFTLITAALGFVAYLIYRKRKAEDTGKPVVFGIFYHIIMTVGIFSLCYLMIMSGTKNFVPVFVISFILYFVMHVIRNRGFGKIVKGLVIYAVTVLLSVGSFLVLNDTKCFGAGDFVPAADKVTKAETYYTGQLENTYITSKNYEIRDPEALSILTQVHRDIIEYYNSDSIDSGFNSYMDSGLLIKYTLSSGRTVTRYYNSVGSKAIDDLSKLDVLEEVKQARAEKVRSTFTDELDRRLKNYDENYVTNGTVKNNSRSDLYAELTPQWTYSEGGKDYNDSCRIGYNDLPADFGAKLGEALYNDIMNESSEEYYTPSGRMWSLSVFGMPSFYIKESYSETMAYLSSCGFTELPEVTKELVEKLTANRDMSLSLYSIPLVGYIEGQDIGSSTYAISNSGSLQYENENGDICTMDMSCFSGVFEYYDDILTLLNHSYKEYKTDESCYTIIVNGNCAVIPTEYSELAERVFIKATADKAERLDRAGFWENTQSYENFWNYRGYSVYLEKLIEFYGKDKIVSALSFYYDRSTAEEMFDKLSKWSETDTDFEHTAKTVSEDDIESGDVTIAEYVYYTYSD